MRPSRRQHFQTSLKPVGQFNSNFLRLLRMGKQMPSLMAKVDGTPIHDKTFKKTFYPEPEG